MNSRGMVARVGLVTLVMAGALMSTACNTDWFGKAAPAAAAAPSEVATVNGVPITERDIAPLLATGLDRVHAVDRAINRVLAANLGSQQYSDEVRAAVKQAETEIAASVFASKRLAELLPAVTDADIEQRYQSSLKDADFNGYQLMFALYATEEDAKAGRAGALASKPEALKNFQPVFADKEGKPLFAARTDVPYNLGVFVAKLKEGEFTEPALVRNGYIVIQAKQIKVNPKPTLESAKEGLRRAIADERLVKQLTDQRAQATISVK